MKNMILIFIIFTSEILAFAEESTSADRSSEVEKNRLKDKKNDSSFFGVMRNLLPKLPETKKFDPNMIRSKKKWYITAEKYDILAETVGNIKRDYPAFDFYLDNNEKLTIVVGAYATPINDTNNYSFANGTESGVLQHYPINSSNVNWIPLGYQKINVDGDAISTLRVPFKNPSLTQQDSFDLLNQSLRFFSWQVNNAYEPNQKNHLTGIGKKNLPRTYQFHLTAMACRDPRVSRNNWETSSSISPLEYTQSLMVGVPNQIESHLEENFGTTKILGADNAKFTLEYASAKSISPADIDPSVTDGPLVINFQDKNYIRRHFNLEESSDDYARTNTYWNNIKKLSLIKLKPTAPLSCFMSLSTDNISALANSNCLQDNNTAPGKGIDALKWMRSELYYNPLGNNSTRYCSLYDTIPTNTHGVKQYPLNHFELVPLNIGCGFIKKSLHNIFKGHLDELNGPNFKALSNVDKVARFSEMRWEWSKELYKAAVTQFIIYKIKDQQTGSLSNTLHYDKSIGISCAPLIGSALNKILVSSSLPLKTSSDGFLEFETANTDYTSRYPTAGFFNRFEAFYNGENINACFIKDYAPLFFTASSCGNPASLSGNGEKSGMFFNVGGNNVNMLFPEVNKDPSKNDIYLETKLRVRTGSAPASAPESTDTVSDNSSDTSNDTTSNDTDSETPIDGGGPTPTPSMGCTDCDDELDMSAGDVEGAEL